MNLIFKLLEDSDVSQAAHCVAEVFSQREPLATTLGFNYDEVKAFSTILCEKAAKEKLGRVVIDASTHQMIGCLVFQDFRGEPLPPIPVVGEDNHKHDIALALLDELKKPLENITQEQGVVSRFVVLAIDSAFTQQGIATKLMKDALVYAKQLGFQYFFAEYTSPYSYKMTQRLDGNMGIDLNTIYFKDFQYEGKYVFKNSPERAILRINNLDQVLAYVTTLQQ